jgi:hypothetical protein
MEDTIVSVRFTELGRARRAFHDLERLDKDGRLKVRGATLVERSGQGGIDTPQAARDDDGHYLPAGGSVGMMLDLLRGPLGILFARPDEDYHGHGGRSPYDGDRDLALEEMSRSLEPGIILLIAEIADPDPDVLDSALAALGGPVTRRPAREVYAEIEAADEAEKRAEEEARRVLREERREKMERFKGSVKAKLP